MKAGIIAAVAFAAMVAYFIWRDTQQRAERAALTVPVVRPIVTTTVAPLMWSGNRRRRVGS